MALFGGREDRTEKPEPPPAQALSTKTVAERIASTTSHLEPPVDSSFEFQPSATADEWKISGWDDVAADKGGAILTPEEFTELKGQIHHRFVDDADLALVSRYTREKLTEQVRELTVRILQEARQPLTQQVRNRLVEAVVSEIIGFGPIETLLADPTVTEIMVNGPNHVYVERDGRLHAAGIKFEDDAHVLRIIERIVAPLGRRIDETSPMVDARLPDGSRVNAVIPPLSVKGPTITVRKFARVPFVMRDLIGFGTLTTQMAEFLEACVYARLNIIISGGTGSGKTTTLNALSGYIPADERIVTIEDAVELQLQQDHVVPLESRPANLEGSGEITIRQLVRNSLRMRPDRIIVGEARGAEALDMLQAMNTGHDGSLSTVHANTPRDALSRLETMVLMAGMDLPVRAIRDQLSSALNLIVQQARLRDGSRKITHITEVQGMEADIVVLQDIFAFQQRGVDSEGRVLGETRPTGLRPQFVHTLEEQGVRLPHATFL